MSPLISAIIVSYNTRQMTLDCLRTLLPELYPFPHEIFVVDNASADDSASAIQRDFPDVTLIHNKDNKGFGAANNQAMTLATGKYFLLLNTDAFPKAGAVRALLDALEANPKAAVVGPRLLNEDGSLQTSCFRFPSPTRAWLENTWLSNLFSESSTLGDYRHWPHDTQRTVDWVVGACMLVRKDSYDQVGGFDERFFMYAEESDWQRRMQNGGWEILFSPAAAVTHLGGQSGASEKPKINNHFFESLDRYELKHHGVIGLISLRAAMVVGCFLRAILWTIAAVIAPPRRAIAWSKTKMHAWLVFRQLTCWRINPVRH